MDSDTERGNAKQGGEKGSAKKVNASRGGRLLTEGEDMERENKGEEPKRLKTEIVETDDEGEIEIEDTKLSTQGAAFYGKISTEWGSEKGIEQGVKKIEETLCNLEWEDSYVRRWGRKCINKIEDLERRERGRMNRDREVDEEGERERDRNIVLYRHYARQREEILDRAGGLVNLRRWLLRKLNLSYCDEGRRAFALMIEERMETEMLKEKVEEIRTTTGEMKKEWSGKSLEEEARFLEEEDGERGGTPAHEEQKEEKAQSSSGGTETKDK